MKNIKVDINVFYDIAQEILQNSGENYRKNIEKDKKTYITMDKRFCQVKGNEYSLIDENKSKILVCSQFTRIKELMGSYTIKDEKCEDSPYFDLEEIEFLLSKSFDEHDLLLLPKILKEVAEDNNIEIIDDNYRENVLKNYNEELKKQSSRIRGYARKLKQQFCHNDDK